MAPLSNAAPTLPGSLGVLARRFGDSVALLSDEESFTFAELAERANRYAGWAVERNIAPGETVCLLMPNRAEFVAIWLGITQTRSVVAVLNPQLERDALIQAIACARPRHLVVDARLEYRIDAISSQLPEGVAVWTHGSARRWPSIDRAVETAPPLAEPPRALPSDTALLIYTSGTTGMPKAAKVSHRRVMEWSLWFSGLLDMQPSDRVFNCLPLCHSVGGVVGIGPALVSGGSVAIRPRFSARRFWDDIAHSEATVFAYIGELCRYLVSSPPHARETKHRLRLCFGNGMRADVWEAFQHRFSIPRILEFYASTEGNLSLYNCEGKRGAVGRVPPLFAHRFPIALIAVDTETGEPVREATGLCRSCRTGEPGEALGLIADSRGKRGRAFEGYTDAEATERKVLRDVVEPGDAWFRTGDLLSRDEAGFFYFVDRMGDTFRWKGENVSTEQMAQAVRHCSGVTDAAAYGVSIPGIEGKAGMVAITGNAQLDIANLHRHLRDTLPSYARPLFLRICSSLARTETFKLAKLNLVRAGYDPAACTDPLYFDERDRGRFVKLDLKLHQQIVSGQLRL